MDAHAAVFSDGDRAALAVLAQSLIDAHPGGTDQGREVRLGEAYRDARAIWDFLTVLAGESEELGGDPAWHVEGGDGDQVRVRQPDAFA